MLPGTTPETLTPEVEIEDRRPSSGHLQINHCCPQNGIFQSSVHLGQTIHTGDEFGRVDDIVIPAENDGRVICLRVIPQVKKDDCLGVILENPN